MGAALDAGLLARVLAEPGIAADLDAPSWTTLIAMARAELLIATLAFRAEGQQLPRAVDDILADAREIGREARRAALWEAEMVRRVLVPLGVPMVLLKGTAFVAGGLSAAEGRLVGDLDLLVPRDALGVVEARLREAGWVSVKDDAYDDEYYRRWMHELPPLVHPDRDRMIDVHHTLLPPTARITPDAAALLASAVPLGDGMAILSPEDMVVHAALHLFADGDLAGGLRNLWDIDRLLREFAEADRDFWLRLQARAAEHGAAVPVARAIRLAGQVFATPVPTAFARGRVGDALFRRRLLARDGWGQEVRSVTRFAFYLRSHWIRMPPLLLARHLGIKAWRRVRPARAGRPPIPR